MSEEKIKASIRDVQDFPKKGIVFKDITPVLQNPDLLNAVIEWYAGKIIKFGKIDIIAGIESRGFIFGSAVAVKLGAGFVPIRKPGKLPHKTLREEYALEYGTDALEIHEDAIRKGLKVAIVDDLLATGGTASAAANLIRSCGGEVTSAFFMIGLDFLDGSQKLKAAGISDIHCLVNY